MNSTGFNNNFGYWTDSFNNNSISTNLWDFIINLPIVDKRQTFIRFAFTKIGMRFKHFIYYLKQSIKKIKGFAIIILIIKMMFCNKLLYIKRKRNK